MNCTRMTAGAVAAVMLTAAAHAAPAKAYFLKAKLSGGGTFVEEGTWDNPSSPTSYKGSGKLTLNVTAGVDVQLVVDNGTVSAFTPPHHSMSSAITANWTASGTSTDPIGTETGSYAYGGAGSGIGSISILDDFSANSGDGLGFLLSFNEPMKGQAKDSRNSYATNPAQFGAPHILGGGDAPVTSKFGVDSSGTFFEADSSRQIVGNTDWKGLVCSGNVSIGWQCGYTGARVFQRGTGTTYTERVQMNAKISIVGKGKW